MPMQSLLSFDIKHIVHGNTYIPAKLIKQYNLEEDIEISYEKIMSWDKKRYSVSWTMTRIIKKE